MKPGLGILSRGIIGIFGQIGLESEIDGVMFPAVTLPTGTTDCLK